MGWNYRRPRPEEYDSDEEYQEAVRMYEWAESDYIDDYEERCREEREFN